MYIALRRGLWVSLLRHEYPDLYLHNLNLDTPDHLLLGWPPYEKHTGPERGIVIVRLEELHGLHNIAIMKSATTCTPNEA